MTGSHRDGLAGTLFYIDATTGTPSPAKRERAGVRAIACHLVSVARDATPPATLTPTLSREREREREQRVAKAHASRFRAC
jgi:hypothetical protein